MTTAEEAIVRRAFDRAVEIARRCESETHYRLCAFFGSIAVQAGCPDITLDALRSEAATNNNTKEPTP